MGIGGAVSYVCVRFKFIGVHATGGSDARGHEDAATLTLLVHEVGSALGDEVLRTQSAAKVSSCLFACAAGPCCYAGALLQVQRIVAMRERVSG